MFDQINAEPKDSLGQNSLQFRWEIRGGCTYINRYRNNKVLVETAKKVKVWFCVRISFKIQDDESLL